MILDPIQELSAHCSLPYCYLRAEAGVATDYRKTNSLPLEVSLDLLTHFPKTARYLNCSLTQLITAHGM